MTREDIPFAVGITDKEDWGYVEEDFEKILELGPKGCFVAHDKDHNVGMLTTVNYGRTAWIGNVVVETERRKENIGSDLILHAVDHLQKESVESIGLYSYLDAVSFYEGIGFKQSFRVGRFSGSGRETTGSSTRKFVMEALPAMAMFDQKYFPGDRTEILSMIAKNDPDLIFWAGNGEVRGYIAGFCSPKACEIGPWVCDPHAPDLAEALLRDCFTALGDKEKSLAVPMENGAAVTIVNENGLSKDFEVVAMFFVTDESHMNLDGLFGVGSLEMG
jgi:ribosomal protein S18 acetylase RimI-like enzyme